MKAKLILILVITGLIFASGIQAGLGEEQEEISLDAAEIMRQLDEVLANQGQILEQIEEMKQELEIIKIRASR